MAFQVTPYHQVCVKKMYIYSGEFFLGNGHCLNPDSQDLGIFPINSEKKQQILHNFTNILAKNIKTPLKSTKTPSKNIGGWVKNIGTPIKNIGALIKNIGTPIKNIGALMKNIGTPIKNIGALIKNIGTPIKNIGALMKNIGIIVRTPFPPILGLTRLQMYMHNVGVRFIAPSGGAWQDTPSGVSNACHPFPFHAKGNINNFTFNPQQGESQ